MSQSAAHRMARVNADRGADEAQGIGVGSLENITAPRTGRHARWPAGREARLAMPARVGFGWAGVGPAGCSAGRRIRARGAHHAGRGSRHRDERSAMFSRAWRSTRASASSIWRARATQAVVSWSSWNLGFGCRLAGERCTACSSSYCGRHIDSRRRGVFGARSTSWVPRKAKMRPGASSASKTSDTQALIRSGKRKVGDVLSSLRSRPYSHSCSSRKSRVSTVSGCSPGELPWAPASGALCEAEIMGASLGHRLRAVLFGAGDQKGRQGAAPRPAGMRPMRGGFRGHGAAALRTCEWVAPSGIRN
mmetsp:Transcript_20652/g.79158  ORF Transcript_20652/g.79158 Transcript_20652/m.79158 type:complete len:306 (-) Transcript_20652:486-1403(-)